MMINFPINANRSSNKTSIEELIIIFFLSVQIFYKWVFFSNLLWIESADLQGPEALRVLRCLGLARRPIF